VLGEAGTEYSIVGQLCDQRAARPGIPRDLPKRARCRCGGARL